MWNLFHLFKRCVLSLSIQRTLVASFGLFIISWVRTCVHINVRKCFARVRSLVQFYLLLGNIFLSGVVCILGLASTSRSLSHVLLWWIKIRNSHIRALWGSWSVWVDMIWWLSHHLTLAKSHSDTSVCMLWMGMSIMHLSLTSTNSTTFSAFVDDPLIDGIVCYLRLRDHLLPVLLRHLNWLAWAAGHCLRASPRSILTHYVPSVCVHLLWRTRSRILLLVWLSYWI